MMIETVCVCILGSVTGIKALNEILITPFITFLYMKDAKQVAVSLPFDVFAKYLVRTAAYKLYLTMPEVSGSEKLKKAVKSVPPSLAHKIEIADKKRAIYNKVLTYLKPVYDELLTKDSKMSTDATIGPIFDFLYKLAIASKLQAEADIASIEYVGPVLDRLRRKIKDDEASFRLDELHGIYYIYQKPMSIDALTIYPGSSGCSISQRVMDLLDDAEIVELSRNRHLLGFPSKVKIAMKNIKKWTAKILTKRKTKSQLSAATDLIQTVSSSAGVEIPLAETLEIIKSIQMSPYSPPIINLNQFRENISSSIALAIGEPCKIYYGFSWPMGNAGRMKEGPEFLGLFKTIEESSESE